MRFEESKPVDAFFLVRAENGFDVGVKAFRLRLGRTILMFRNLSPVRVRLYVNTVQCIQRVFYVRCVNVTHTECARRTAVSTGAILKHIPSAVNCVCIQQKSPAVFLDV